MVETEDLDFRVKEGNLLFLHKFDDDAVSETDVIVQDHFSDIVKEASDIRFFGKAFPGLLGSDARLRACVQTLPRRRPAASPPG